MTTCAIWLRVSTEHQNEANQRPDLERLAAQRGYTIVREYVIHGSSAYTNGREYRDTLSQMIADAHAGLFEAVLIWAADRISRSGIEDLLRIIRELRERNVTLLSCQEPWLSGGDATTELLAAVAGWNAKQESEHRSERIKAGMAKRRADLAAGYTVRGRQAMGGRVAGARDKAPRSAAYRARISASHARRPPQARDKYGQFAKEAEDGK